MGNTHVNLSEANSVPLANRSMQNNQYALQQDVINSNNFRANQIINPQQFEYQNIQNNNDQSLQNIQAQLIYEGIPQMQAFEVVQIPQQLNDNLMKNQPFHIQKKEIVHAAIIFLVIQIIPTLFYYWLQIRFSNQTQPIQFPIPQEVLLIAYLLVIISGKFQYFSKNPIAVIKTLIIIVIQCASNTISFFFIKEEIQRIDKILQINIENFQIQLAELMVLQLVVLLITIVYIILEQKEIRFKKYYQILLPLLFVGFVTQIFDIFVIFCLVFYGSIFLIVLRQLMNGRFQLQKGQTFGICNAIYLGLLVPCNIC